MTASDKIKRLWHSTCFKLNEKTEKLIRSSNWMSLKDFARSLVEEPALLAKEWYANKHGERDANRSEKNIARVATEKQATKASRHKNKR